MPAVIPVLRSTPREESDVMEYTNRPSTWDPEVVVVQLVGHVLMKGPNL
jgi:hypothetical protein